jgi:predicted  nucleic acid-binding Zn-ribbon protein
MATSDEIWQALVRFDREIIAPRFDQLRSEMVTRDEFLGHMDNIYKQFQRIDTELIAIRGGLKRLEMRMDAVEQKLDKMALRSDLEALEHRVIEIEHEIAEIKTRL